MTGAPTILVAIGTRPEAIKLAPVVHALADAEIGVRVCLTEQHCELLEHGLCGFDIPVHHRLGVMSHDQDPSLVLRRAVAGMQDVLTRDPRPNWLIVQGDTTSALAAGLAGFYAGVPVAHVEAGLRTGEMRQPWPEEMHRRLLAQLAALHFAPTERAFANLIAEGVDPAHIEITGNTAIDALRIACDELARRPELGARGEALVARLPAGRAIILATVHRRENHGAAELSGIAKAFAAIVAREDCELLLLAHPNPGVARLVEHLSGRQHVHIVPPLDYFAFVALLRRATLLMTDSGGIQEEAACLGKPVLVLRASTERAEILTGGNGRIVGALADRIVAEAFRLLDDPHALALMSRAHDSFGDGYAAERIARRMLANLPARQTIA